MGRHWVVVSALGFVLFASVPASAQDTVKAAAAPARILKPPKSGGPYHVTSAEVDYVTGVNNAMELIQRLRPAMLRKRMGARTENGPSADIEVYVDGRHIGPLESLRDVEAGSVLEVFYLNSGDATLRFGVGNTEGAILITSRGSKRKAQ